MDQGSEEIQRRCHCLIQGKKNFEEARREFVGE
jgi:hypothetical protein